MCYFVIIGQYDCNIRRAADGRGRAKTLPRKEAEMTGTDSYGNREKVMPDQIKILVCDDDKEIAGAIEIYLHNEGYNVFKAYDGLEALEIVKREELHLIIMDIMMPVMGGLEAAHAIRTMERADSNKVPIVAISANAFDEDIHRSLASGMNAHLSKPVEIDKLRETLGRLLK